MIDFLRGGGIRRDLLAIENNLREERDTTKDDLHQLLQHAARTTEFYAAFSGHFGIRDFPVINKKRIKDQTDRFVSSAFKNKKLHKMSTSGSTGERFVVLQDLRKRRKVLAEVLYFHKLSGFNLGDRYLYVKVWTRENMKSKRVQLAENLIPFDCSHLSDRTLYRLYEGLKRDGSVRCLIGYANALASIASFLDRQGATPDMFRIRTVVCSAERLEAPARVLIEKVFGCPVVSRYSNQENGVLAQQLISGESFILNTAHYFFETLRIDTDEPAQDGEPARLVVTDLFNYAMPLIRYDTEDIVIAKTVKCIKGRRKVLTDITGRKEDILFTTQGDRIHPSLIRRAFQRYDRLLRFQFIQEDRKSYTLRLENVCGFYEDAVFQTTLEALVGQGALIRIEHWDEIPAETSGKHRTIISHYKSPID